MNIYVCDDMLTEMTRSVLIIISILMIIIIIKSNNHHNNCFKKEFKSIITKMAK